jgi:hypothetical protein
MRWLRGKQTGRFQLQRARLLPVVPGTADERDRGKPIERMLPTETALRQWVLTFPLAWRPRLAPLGQLTRIFVDTVQGF